MKVLIKELAHHHRLNPDQLVAFAVEYHNKYQVIDYEKNPLDNAKTSTWFSDHLVNDFKKANRPGHDWRENLKQNENVNMRNPRLVKEDIAVDPKLATQYSNAKQQKVAKDKQIMALQQQIQRIEVEKIELDKAIGAIEQQSGIEQAQQQKELAQQQKEQAAKVASDAAAGKTNTTQTATTPQNSSFPDILLRVDNKLTEDEIDDKIRYSPNFGRMDWQRPGTNWYNKPVSGGHKERPPRPKVMSNTRRQKIRNWEDEIQDLRSDMESWLMPFQAPNYEGIEGEIENFFGEVGPEGSEILNSGAYKNDKEKIKALKDAGVKNPEGTLQNLYYYFPEFDESKQKERKKAEKEAAKIQKKIDSIQAKIDKYEKMYESLNEAKSFGVQEEIRKLEAQYDELADELAVLMNEKAPKSHIDAIKQELREINQDIRSLEEQDELDQEAYRKYEIDDVMSESYNPASVENFYSLNEDYVETEQEKKTPEGYLEKDYVFYVRVTEDGEEFIGKIFKDSPDEDWYGLVKIGESDTFEKMSYEPDYNEVDIVDFLSETYDDVEIIEEDEYDELMQKEDEGLEESLNESFDDCSVDVLDYEKCIKALQTDNPEYDLRYSPDKNHKYSYKIGLYKNGKYIGAPRGSVKLSDAYDFFKSAIANDKQN